MKYRQKDKKQLFKPANFNIMLMTASGEFVTACFGNRFMFSLLNQKIMLQPGKYVIMIDPVWNSTVQNDDMYREVMVDVYGPQVVALSQVDDVSGMQVLARACKQAALKITPEEQR